MGESAEAITAYTTAVGQRSSARERQSTALGSRSIAQGIDATAAGEFAIASGQQSSAFGRAAQAWLLGNTAIGAYARTEGTSSTAVGQLAYAHGDYSVSVGSNANAMGAGSIAIGADARAAFIDPTTQRVIFERVDANGVVVDEPESPVEPRREDYASDEEFQAAADQYHLDYDAHLEEYDNYLATTTARGPNSAIAFGNKAIATADMAIAFGTFAEATAESATAFGHDSKARGLQSTALGAETIAAFDNSTALGYGAITTRDFQFMFGTQSNTYTMPGIVTDASRLAQTGDLEYIMTDQFGNLASDGGAFRTLQNTVASTESMLVDTKDDLIEATERLDETIERLGPTWELLEDPNAKINGLELEQKIDDQENSIVANTALGTENQTRITRAESDISSNSEAISLLNNQFETLGMQVDELVNRVSENTHQINDNKAGIAIANAMAGTSWLQANETHAFTANWGHYDNTNAFALSATQRLDNQWSANMGIGFSPDEGKFGARAGVRIGW